MSIHFTLGIETLVTFDYTDEQEVPFKDDACTLQLGNSRYYRRFVAEKKEYIEEFEDYGQLEWSNRSDIIEWLCAVRCHIRDFRLSAAISYLIALPEESDNFKYLFTIYWA